MGSPHNPLGISGPSVHTDIRPSMDLTGCYSPGHSRIFEKPLRLFNTPLAVGGSGQVYMASSEAGQPFLVKLYKVYGKDHMAWDRALLLKKGVQVSDADLNYCFNPWHRESRAYERIDERVRGSARSLFPEYYGTAKLLYSSCPEPWRRANPDHGDVCMVILELLDQPRPCQDGHDLRLSDYSLILAKNLHSDSMDPEYIHIFIHLCEMVETLHHAEIIHADLKEDNIIGFAIAGRPMLLDFSKSWTYSDNIPCLDPFKKKPWTFEERRIAELDTIKFTVLSESKRSGEKQFLRNKFPNASDCQRCATLMTQITSA
ncbi:hypothetical protein BKA64DRAFT_655078 [Cadophora sp. MPI-SDFR-AT-0126]|nr:hypothetical protein BKA64DRAFT_655078 [Leotiomycetes sp. MPI-SDFR-AT-0126]